MMKLSMGIENDETSSPFTNGRRDDHRMGSHPKST
jgi:hypothetical protein